jgi:hypothetical protein
VVGFDRVVRVLLGHVVGSGEQLIQHPWVGRRPVGGHLRRSSRVPEGTGEEPAGGRQVSLFGGQHVDDLPELVHRPIQIDPPTGDLHVGLIDKPAIARSVPAWLGHVDEQRRGPLHPPIHRYVIHLDAPFGKQFFGVAVGKAVAQVPADSDRDRFWWEAEPGEGRPRHRCRDRTTAHQPTLPDPRSVNATVPCCSICSDRLNWDGLGRAAEAKLRETDPELVAHADARHAGESFSDGHTPLQPTPIYLPGWLERVRTCQR